MAEAIELNLPLGEGGAESVEKIIKPLLEIEKEKKKLINQTGSVEERFLIAMATYDNPRQNIIG